MEKKKTYNATLFSANVIQEAVDAAQKIAADGEMRRVRGMGI